MDIIEWIDRMANGDGDGVAKGWLGIGGGGGGSWLGK
jgi:hypothetical protein